MPCNVTLRGPAQHKDECEYTMQRKGYTLSFSVNAAPPVFQSQQPSYSQSFNGNQSRAAPPPKASYRAKGNANRELVKMTNEQVRIQLFNDCNL